MAIAVGYFYDLTLLSDRVIYINAKIRPDSTRTDENAKCIFYAECFTLRTHYDKKISRVA